MRRQILVFVLGAFVGIVALLGGGYVYARLGLVNPRADIPVPSLEKKTAMTFLDASIDRRARDEKNPVSADEVNLIAGMSLYQAHCAGCHGDVTHPESSVAKALYPRPPQFIQEAPDMPDNQNFYLLKHGIRWSGMPAFKQSLTDQQIWEIVGFLSHMDKLSPHIKERWKTQSK